MVWHRRRAAIIFLLFTVIHLIIIIITMSQNSRLEGALDSTKIPLL